MNMSCKATYDESRDNQCYIRQVVTLYYCDGPVHPTMAEVTSTNLDQRSKHSGIRHESCTSPLLKAQVEEQNATTLKVYGIEKIYG